MGKKCNTDFLHRRNDVFFSNSMNVDAQNVVVTHAAGPDLQVELHPYGVCMYVCVSESGVYTQRK